MIRIAVLVAGLLVGCGAGGGPVDAAHADDAADASTDLSCDDCAMADLCCAAHTANPDGNCELLATCVSFTGTKRLSVLDGCRDYLRVASTPPAPAACGPHPDAE